MKNKRFAFALAAVLLVCLLPVWAMATEWNLADPDQCPLVHNTINLQNVQDGDVITGTAPAGTSYVVVMIPKNATLTLKDVRLSGVIDITVGSAPDYGTVTLKLEGENNIQSQSDSLASINILGKLKLSEGATGMGSLLARQGCEMTLPQYIGSIPAGGRFVEWLVSYGTSAEIKQPGETIQINETVSISPILERPASSAPPKTGDDSNVVLWSALALTSMIGLTLTARRRKEA